MNLIQLSAMTVIEDVLEMGLGENSYAYDNRQPEYPAGSCWTLLTCRTNRRDGARREGGDKTYRVSWHGSDGHLMASRLLAAGYPVTVWNRTKQRVTLLIEASAQGSVYPADAVEGKDLIITMLTDPDAVTDCLGDRVTVLNEHLRDSTSLLPDSFCPIDFAWIDAWNCLYFFDHLWNVDQSSWRFGYYALPHDLSRGRGPVAVDTPVSTGAPRTTRDDNFAGVAEANAKQRCGQPTLRRARPESLIHRGT